MKPYTYEKQLGMRNLTRRPSLRGASKGKILDWATKTHEGESYPFMVPDHWEDDENLKFMSDWPLKPLPSGIQVIINYYKDSGKEEREWVEELVTTK